MTNVKKIVAHNLCCIRQDKLLFENISFELMPGQVLLVEGPNGAGKSSLLRLLSGLTTPTAGNIFWQDTFTQTAGATYSEHLHYIGHTNGIQLGLTVAENMQLISQLALTHRLELDAVLACLQLSAYHHTLANHLSAGQRRRIALAKLFLLPKSLWILDEPCTALDLSTQTILLAKLEDHLHQNGMAIISSHQPMHLEKRTAQIVRLGAC